jgi:hypothetical protein
MAEQINLSTSLQVASSGLRYQGESAAHNQYKSKVGVSMHIFVLLWPTVDAAG